MFYFAYGSSKKRSYFTASIFSFVFFISSIAITYNQYRFAKNEIYAIVFSEKVDVKNGPTVSSENIFTLHEGTKVKVLDTVDQWKKIKLVDGEIGWIAAKEITTVEPFLNFI